LCGELPISAYAHNRAYLAHICTFAAVIALIIVNDRMVINNVYSALLTVFLAQLAADTAALTQRACDLGDVL
jgi:hypothetical protein